MSKYIKYLLIIAILLLPFYLISTSGLNQIKTLTEKNWRRSWAPNLYYTIGKIFFYTNRYDESIKTFKRFIEVYTKHDLTPYALFYYAKSLENKEDEVSYREALRQYKTFLEEYPEHTLKGEVEKAIYYIEKIKNVRLYDE